MLLPSPSTSPICINTECTLSLSFALPDTLIVPPSAVETFGSGLGAGYNIIQSMLAVGSGQVWGMGLFNGNQTQLGYLPMKTTDFIYSVISEEMGFVISSVVIILFVLLIVRTFHIAKNAKDTLGTLIATYNNLSGDTPLILE